MPDTFRVGSASIEVNQDNLRKLLDQASKGASESFVRQAEAELRPIMAGAVARWPVRSGRSRDAFRIATTLRPASIEVAIVNDATSGSWGAYAYKIRWSVRTKASLDAEAASVSGDDAKWAAVRIAKETGHRATSQQLAEAWRRRLTKRHGQGAPDEASAGKQPWRVLVENPGKVALNRLIPRLQADLDRLAGG